MKLSDSVKEAYVVLGAARVIKPNTAAAASVPSAQSLAAATICGTPFHLSAPAVEHGANRICLDSTGTRTTVAVGLLQCRRYLTLTLPLN